MLSVLSPSPKTIPSNYQIKPIDVSIGGEAGSTLDEEAWDKHERQCSPFYDWSAYERSFEEVLFEHPVYARRMREDAMVSAWNELLNHLEPFNPHQ